MLLAIAVSGCQSGDDDDDNGGASPGDREKVAVTISICDGESLLAGLALEGLMTTLSGEMLKVTQDDVECITAAADCNEYFACGGMDSSKTCEADSFEEKCASDTAILECEESDSGLSLERTKVCADVSPENPTCFETANGPECGLETCTGEKEGCDGDVREECKDGVFTRMSCDELGLHCFANETDSWCAHDDTTECSKSFCENNRLVSCLFGKPLFGVECGLVEPGFVCMNDAGHGEAECGLHKNDRECTLGEGECVGNLARLCIGGKWFEFDCALLAGAACKFDEEAAALEPDEEPMAFLSCVSPDWP